MPAPSVTWTDISPARLQSNAPADASLVDDIYDNIVFCRELFIGTNTTLAAVPHSHLGVTDGAITALASDNILQNSAPDDDGDGDWTTSGIEIESDKGFLVSTTDGSFAWQRLFTSDSNADITLNAFGTTGADWCLSIFVRARTQAPTAGILSFGLADGSTSSYISGCRADISYTQITTAWQRFYMTLDAKGGSASTDVRFLLCNGAGANAALNQQTVVTCMAVTFGKVLTYWMPGVGEASGNGDTHDDWRRYGLTDIAAWEQATGLHNATKISGV